MKVILDLVKLSLDLEIYQIDPINGLKDIYAAINYRLFGYPDLTWRSLIYTLSMKY